jgi:UDP-N-acetylglucosamine diphosphorylase/glucosamine-1-phosphate N-acetyltransferase
MRLVIFDDDRIEDFYPLTLTRSTSDLRVGILKLGQRLKAFFEQVDTKLITFARFTDLYRERHPDWQINELDKGEYLFVNSRLVVNDHLVEVFKGLSTCSGYINNNIICGFKVCLDSGDYSSENIDKIIERIKFTELEEAGFWKYPWDLISANSVMIEQDFKEFFYEKENHFETEPGVTILNPYDVWIGEGAVLGVNVIIDASEGPVVIDEGAVIMPTAVIVGPAYIGKKSRIKIGAKIYEGTSIGPVCKIGGEVEETIFQAYSNKQHDGFLGHAYLGEWVNLGAGTSNSDLKNNYKNVKVYNYSSGKKIDSETQFMGCVIGDHTKIGINCSINTGTVIGTGCNLWGKELIDSFIPSYSWGDAENLASYQLDKFLETVEVVKARRKLPLTEVERILYSKIPKGND